MREFFETLGAVLLIVLSLVLFYPQETGDKIHQFITAVKGE